MFAEADRFGGGPRDGERGELGDGDADLDVIKRNAGPFEGDLDSERRNCLNADAGSTWCMCVGDGKCKVPPASPGEEHVGNMEELDREIPVEAAGKQERKPTPILVLRNNEAFRLTNRLLASGLFIAVAEVSASSERLNIQSVTGDALMMA
ncbi:hypothetical protein MMC07_009374 [Pseudocyphellaria aurata]|nr:hypothetical protein [Pseudocyphellaria aurata]